MAHVHMENFLKVCNFSVIYYHQVFMLESLAILSFLGQSVRMLFKIENNTILHAALE